MRLQARPRVAHPGNVRRVLLRIVPEGIDADVIAGAVRKRGRGRRDARGLAADREEQHRRHRRGHAAERIHGDGDRAR